MAVTAMWVWDTKIENNADEVDLLRLFCEREGIRTIFYSVYEITVDRELTLRSLLRAMHRSSIEVHALFGKAEWGLSEFHNEPMGIVRQILAFNSLAPANERFDGIHDDSEVYALATWAFNPLEMLGSYLELIEGLSDLIGPDLKFGAAVPFWFTERSLSASACSRARTLAEEIFFYVDYVAIMAYRDRAFGQGGTIEISKPFIEIAGAAGKKAYVGQETQPDLNPSYMSFYGKPASYMRGEFKKIDSYFEGHSGYAGIAAHRYRTYRALLESDG